MKLHNTKKGFTIIETLVAVAILMIAIAGPLTIAHKGLLAAVYAHDQINAAYLAQDAVEYVKNVRDNNYIRFTTTPTEDWLFNLRGCEVNNKCAVDTLVGNPANPLVSGVTACAGTCDLYKGDAGYTHDTSLSKTKFTRTFHLTSITDNSAKIVVEVKWKNGTIDNHVLYENQIYKVLK